MNRALAWLGALAAGIYAATVILGGALWPGYDHLRRFVSELLRPDATDAGLLSLMFALYNLLCAAFGLVLFVLTRRDLDNPRRTAGMTSALVLMAEASVGVAMLFFPQDAAGAPLTRTGTMHLVLAAVSSLASMAAMLLLALWFRGGASRRGLGIYSLASLAFVFLSGGMAAGFAAGHGPYPGLLERLTIGGFLQWLVVTGLALPRIASKRVSGS